MKLKDAEKIKVEIEYGIEFNKEEIEDYLKDKKSDDETCDDMIREAEERCVSGSGDHQYGIYGWNGTSWESIDDE